MVTQNLRESLIKYESVFMNSDFSDHVPLCLETQIDVSYHGSFERKCKNNVAWHKCTEVHIENYNRELDKLISCIDFNHDAVLDVLITNVNCTQVFSLICIILL